MNPPQDPNPPGGTPADEVRAFYDAVAHVYAERHSDELAEKPHERELLKRFAGSVRRGGVVADLGSGPGQTAAFLKAQGVVVRGLDLSPNFVAEARRRHPRIQFIRGDMLALPFADATLAGVIAFYSIVHFSDQQVAQAIAEIHRVLEPGAPVLLAFHVGKGVMHVDEFLGTRLSMDFRLFDPIDLSADLAVGGFAHIEVSERDPVRGVEFPSRRAFVIARKYSP